MINDLNDAVLLCYIADHPGHCAYYYAGATGLNEIYVRDYVGRMLDAGVLVTTYSVAHPYTAFVHAVKVK